MRPVVVRCGHHRPRHRHQHRHHHLWRRRTQSDIAPTTVPELRVFRRCRLLLLPLLRFFQSLHPKLPSRKKGQWRKRRKRRKRRTRRQKRRLWKPRTRWPHRPVRRLRVGLFQSRRKSFQKIQSTQRRRRRKRTKMDYSGRTTVRCNSHRCREQRPHQQSPPPRRRSWCRQRSTASQAPTRRDKRHLRKSPRRRPPTGTMTLTMTLTIISTTTTTTTTKTTRTTTRAVGTLMSHQHLHQHHHNHHHHRHTSLPSMRSKPPSNAWTTI